MDFCKTTKSPIILKEENKRFALDPNRDLRGYVKLEQDMEKSLIIAVMENLKFFPKGDYVYKLIMAGMKNEARCYHLVGNISLSAYGKGEGSFRINSADLDGNGSALWDFSTIIIAAMSTVNFREALHPVLKGDMVFTENADSDTSAACTSESDSDSNSASDSGSSSDSNSGSSSDPYNSKTAAETPIPKDYSPFYNRFVLENCIDLAKRQDDYRDIVPFENDITDASWKKITDINRFPVIAPGGQEPMEKYGHFLFGWSDSHYFIGIPGRFFPEEQPDGGKSGFVYWQPILGMEREADDRSIPIEERRKNIYGYWIGAVNRYNGHIEEIPLIDN